MKYILPLVALLISTLVNAVEIKLGDYKNRADVNEFVERMARQSDYSEQELIDLLEIPDHGPSELVASGQSSA